LLASRNLGQNLTRFAISVAGVALAIMLVLLLNGLMRGMQKQITLYLDNTPGSVVLTQAGVNNLAVANSLLPPGLEEEVRQIPGVAKAIPVLSQSVFFDLHGKKIFAYLIGYDPAQGGGPWRFAAGRQPRTGREVVIDQILARIHGIKVGDILRVGDYTFPVVGLSAGTSSWMTTLVFVRKSELERYLLIPGLSSFLLVVPTPGTAAATLRQRLQGVSGGEAWLKPQLAANDLNIYQGFFRPIRLMGGIAFLVGTLVVGLVVYTLTLERSREYGVLKAIGSGNRRLYSLVLSQALLVGGAGALAGLLLAWGAGGLVMRLRPQFLVVLEPQAVLIALASGLVMALLAALIPARVVARLAPADVFRR